MIPFRRTIILIPITVVFTVFAFFIGPYFPLRPVASPEVVEAVEKAVDLDLYLADREARVAGLKPYLRKRILWHDPESKARTPMSVVYIHGFSASPLDTSPLPEVVAKRLGANLYFARLAAHGLKDGEAFANVDPQSWIEDAREAYAISRRVGDRVILIGMSTGAALAVQLAYEEYEKSEESSSALAALVLLSPNFQTKDSRAKYISGPFGAIWARIFIGSHRSFPTYNAVHEDYWTSRYRSQGVVALMDLLNHISNLDLSRIQAPVLTLYTRKDDVVSVPMIEKKHQEFGSARKKILELPQAARHELVGKALAPEVVEPAAEEIIKFVKSEI